MVKDLTYQELLEQLNALEKESLEYKREVESRDDKKSTAQKYLDIAGVVIVAINEHGQMTLINKKGCQVLGYSEEELIGKNWFDDFVPVRVRDEVEQVFRKLMSGEKVNVEHYRNPVITRNGEERIIEWYNTLLTNDSGSIIGTLSSGEDVTERVRAEEALKKANEELSRFNRELEKIVQQRTEELEEKSKQLIEAERLAALGKIANRVAHEIRNPLTVIGGFARRMKEHIPDEDENTKYLNIILREVEVLERRVAEIIKVENEKRDLVGQ
jgi:PAS domain S-box-containing protein